MHDVVDLRVVELLSARLCHELISPIGAISNGVEILAEEDAEFARDAIDLIGQSTLKANRRLQFYRFAYGGGSSASVDAGTMVAGLLEETRVACAWSAALVAQPVAWRRLLANMVLAAVEILPRGGTLVARPRGSDGSGVEVEASGEVIQATPEFRAALSGDVAVEALTARTVHVYFTARLARSLGAAISLVQDASGTMRLAAEGGVSTASPRSGGA